MKWLKHSKKIAVTLVILQIALGLTQLATNKIAFAGAASPELNLEVKYTIQIRDGGLVVINALVNLRNDGTEPISSLKIGFSEAFEQNLDDVFAYESQELDVRKEGVDVNVFWVSVDFANPIENGQTTNLSVYFVFSRLITNDQSSSSIYNVTFPAAPVLQFDVARCEIMIELPKDAIAQESSLRGLLNEINVPLKAYSNQSGFVTFIGDIRILECISANSEVILDSWGSLYFYDSYNIRNIGKMSVSDIVLRLPLAVEEVSVHDAGGSLDITVNNLDGGKEVKIGLRYPIRGVEGVATYYEACSFTVNYKINSRAYVSSTGSWANYMLSIRFPTRLNLTVKNLELHIVLPEGARYQTASYSGEVSINGLTPSLKYVFKNISLVHVLDFTVDYDYVFFWAALRPTLWVGGIAATISVFIFHRDRKRLPSLAISDKNVKLLNSFANVFDERIMLWSELDSLEENLDNRGIRKKDYNRRKRIIQQRLRALDNVWTSLKSDVRQISTRYAELISKTDRTNAEILALRDNINRFRKQYRSGRLSKSSYNKLKGSYERKVEGVNRTLESVIIELKSTN